MYIYIYIYIYIYVLPPRSETAYGQFSKVQSGKVGPAPGRFEFSKGILK